MKKYTDINYQRRICRHVLKNGISVLKPIGKCDKNAPQFQFKLLEHVLNKLERVNGKSVSLFMTAALNFAKKFIFKILGS